MSEVGQKQILSFVVFLIMSALVFFYREFFLDLVQQSYFIIIVIMLGFLYFATRSKTSTQEPVYSSRDQFSATINTQNISKPVLKDEIHKWIKTRQIWVTINVTHEDENLIQIKSPVQLITSGLSARWTQYPMMIYYITFIFQENQIEINAEVEYPRYNQFFSLHTKLPNYLGILKCRDFICTFFKQLDIYEDVLYRELYSKSELEAYLRETDNTILRFFLIILGLLTVFTFLGSENIVNVIYSDIVGGIFLGVFIFGTAQLQSRKYRHILNSYFKDKYSSTFT